MKEFYFLCSCGRPECLSLGEEGTQAARSTPLGDNYGRIPPGQFWVSEACLAQGPELEGVETIKTLAGGSILRKVDF